MIQIAQGDAVRIREQDPIKPLFAEVLARNLELILPRNQPPISLSCMKPPTSNRGNKRFTVFVQIQPLHREQRLREVPVDLNATSPLMTQKRGCPQLAAAAPRSAAAGVQKGGDDQVSHGVSELTIQPRPRPSFSSATRYSQPPTEHCVSEYVCDRLAQNRP